MAEDTDIDDAASQAARDSQGLDPELVGLVKPPRTVGPLLSLSVIAFCGYMLFGLRGDFAFARASHDAMDATVADIAQGKVETETMVRVAAPLDAVRGITVRVGGDDVAGRRMLAVAGSNNAVWVTISGKPWLQLNQRDQVYEGRLRRLSSLHFGDAAVAHADQRRALRLATPASIRASLRGQRDDIVLLTGDKIVPADGDKVQFRRRELDLTVRTSPAVPDMAAWGAKLTDLGLIAGEDTPRRATDEQGTYSVRPQKTAHAPFPSLDSHGIRAALAKYGDAGTIRLEWRYGDPVVTTWGQLNREQTPDAFTNAGQSIPWGQLEVAIAARFPVPNDAYVVITDEHPTDFWYVQPLAIVFVLGCILFIWALIRYIRAYQLIRKHRVNAAPAT